MHQMQGNKKLKETKPPLSFQNRLFSFKRKRNLLSFEDKNRKTFILF